MNKKLQNGLTVTAAMAMAMGVGIPVTTVLAASPTVATKAPASKYGISYEAQVQNVGWQKPGVSTIGEQADISLATEAGTDGRNLRVEALKLTGTNLPAGASITYQAYVQNKGWVAQATTVGNTPVEDAGITGTVGQSLRIEAFRITLQGLPGYAVEYQAHVQNKGWMTPASQTTNGTDITAAEVAGTNGLSLRMEALKIEIVKTTVEKNAESAAMDAVTLAESTKAATDITAATNAIVDVKDPIEIKNLNDRMNLINAITVTTVSAINPITVANGTTADKLGLPTTVPVTLSDGTADVASIAWDTTAYVGTKAGTTLINGTLSVPAGKTWVLTDAQKATSATVTVNAASSLVSTVSGITKTTAVVKLAAAPAADLTVADAAKFTVLANGTANVVTKVEKDFTDLTNKTYKLTFTDTLDKTQGNLTINGVAPATKVVTGSDFDYDYKTPSVVSVVAKGNKSIVVKFDEKMSNVGTALANFNLVKTNVPGTPLLTAPATSVLSADKTEVTLTFATAMVPAQYTLILGTGAAATVQDLASNSIYQATEVNFAPTADQLTITAAPGVAIASYNNGKGQITLTFDKNLTSVDVTKLSINGVALTSADTVTTSGNTSVITLSTATKAKVDAITNALSLTSVKDAYTDGTNSTTGEIVSISKVSPAVISNGSYNQETNVVTLNFDQNVKISDATKIKLNDSTTSDEASLVGATKIDGTTSYTATELATASSTWTFKLSSAEATKLEATANDKTKLKAYMVAGAVTNDDATATGNVDIAYAKGGAVSYSADSTNPFVKGVAFDYVTALGSTTEGDASALTLELNEKSTISGTIKIATAATGDINEVDLNVSALTDSKNKISLASLSSDQIANLKNLFESGKDIKVFFAKDIVTDDNALKNDEVTFDNGISLTYNDYVKPALTTFNQLSVKDSTHIVVGFTEPMDATTVDTAANYIIKDATGASLNVVSAQLQSDKKSVLLTTEAQTNNKPYSIKVTAVKDVKGNTITDVTNNFLGTGTVLDTKLSIASGSTVVINPNSSNDVINIKFNNAVDMTTAKTLANYAVFTENTGASDLTKSVSLTGSTITLSADQKTVSIKLANHDVQAGKNYKVVVSNLKDMYGNILDTSVEDNYMATIVPSNGATETGNVSNPTAVAFMNADGNATVELTYSEELNKANAENKAGYVVAGITNEANIASAVYTPYDATTGKSKVTLTLSEGITLAGTTDVTVKGGSSGIVTDLAGYKLVTDANLTVAVADLVKPTLATTSPIVATAKTLANSDSVVLTFSEPITTSGKVLDERNYTVKVNGVALSAKANVETATADTPYVVTALGNAVTISLDSADANIVKGDTVEVTVAGNEISDLAGLTLDQASASVSTVAASTAVNTAAVAAFTDSRTVETTFVTNGVLASTVSKDDFVVDGNVVNAVSVSGKVVTLTLAAQVQAGTVIVKPSSTFAIKDDMGNDLTNATLGSTTGITTGNTVEDISLAGAMSAATAKQNSTGYVLNTDATKTALSNALLLTEATTANKSDKVIAINTAIASLEISGTAQQAICTSNFGNKDNINTFLTDLDTAGVVVYSGNTVTITKANVTPEMKLFTNANYGGTSITVAALFNGQTAGLTSIDKVLVNNVEQNDAFNVDANWNSDYVRWVDLDGANGTTTYKVFFTNGLVSTFKVVIQ